MRVLEVELFLFRLQPVRTGCCRRVGQASCVKFCAGSEQIGLRCASLHREGVRVSLLVPIEWPYEWLWHSVCLKWKGERTGFGSGRKWTRKPLFLTFVLPAVFLNGLEGEKPLWRAPLDRDLPEIDGRWNRAGSEIQDLGGDPRCVTSA
jgi:hypothetical protein